MAVSPADEAVTPPAASTAAGQDDEDDGAVGLSLGDREAQGGETPGSSAPEAPSAAKPGAALTMVPTLAEQLTALTNQLKAGDITADEFAAAKKAVLTGGKPPAAAGGGGGGGTATKRESGAGGGSGGGGGGGDGADLKSAASSSNSLASLDGAADEPATPAKPAAELTDEEKKALYKQASTKFNIKQKDCIKFLVEKVKKTVVTTTQARHPPATISLPLPLHPCGNKERRCARRACFFKRMFCPLGWDATPEGPKPECGAMRASRRDPLHPSGCPRQKKRNGTVGTERRRRSCARACAFLS